MDKITPLNGYIVIKPIESSEETFGNIIIPDLGKERPEMGEVVEVSSTYNFNTDKSVESALKPGQTVLIPKLGTARIVFNGQDYFLCKETEILASIS
jgi:chaperonin GroES